LEQPFCPSVQPTLVAAATTTTATTGEDNDKDYRDDDRCEDEARDEQPPRAAPGAQSTTPSILLMKCGHPDHLPCVISQGFDEFYDLKDESDSSYSKRSCE
jgi:hypothetical protein